jgi:hypothetical protein
VASTQSEDWSIGDPIEGIPCSRRGSTGCYQVELPAGDLYWVRIGGRTDFGTADNTGNGEFEIELGVDDRQADIWINSTSALVGRVVDPLGVPVPGARVIAIPSARVPRSFPTARPARTDAGASRSHPAPTGSASSGPTAP